MSSGACTCRASARRRCRTAHRRPGRGRIRRRAASMMRSPSVLRSLMSGPRTKRRVPSSSASTWSTILDALALDGVAVGAVGDADPGEQQPEVVVDLGDRAHGRARFRLAPSDRSRWPATGRRSGRRRASPSGRGTAGIGAEALDVPPLPLGVDGVEGETGLAGATQTRDDDEAVAREGDGDVLEVVFARAAHDELVLGHDPSLADAGDFEQVFVPACRPSAGGTTVSGAGSPPRWRCRRWPRRDTEGQRHAADDRPAALPPRTAAAMPSATMRTTRAIFEMRPPACRHEHALDQRIGLRGDAVRADHDAERGEVEGLRDRQVTKRNSTPPN